MTRRIQTCNVKEEFSMNSNDITIVAVVSVVLVLRVVASFASTASMGTTCMITIIHHHHVVVVIGVSPRRLSYIFR